MLEKLEDYVFLADPEGSGILLVERTGEVWKQPFFCRPRFQRRTDGFPLLFDWKKAVPGPCRWHWKEGFLPVLEIRGENTLLEMLCAGEALLVRKNETEVLSFPALPESAALFGRTLDELRKKWENFFRKAPALSPWPGHAPDAWRSCLVQALSAFRGRHPRYGVGCYGYAVHDGCPPTIIAMCGALPEFGHPETAFSLMDYYLERFVTAEGRIDYYGPSVAEYGMLLTVCGGFAACPGGTDWLQEHRRTLGAMAARVIRARNPWLNGSDAPERRLIPGVPEADTRADRGIYTHNNVWAWRGLLSWARSAKMLGLREAAREAEAEAADLHSELTLAIRGCPSPGGLTPFIIRPGFRLRDFQENQENTYANYSYYPELLAGNFLDRDSALKEVEAREKYNGEMEGMTLFNYKINFPGVPEAPEYACDNWPIFCYGRALAELGERERLAKVIEGHYRYHQTTDTYTAYEIVDAESSPRHAVTDWCVPAQLAYPCLLKTYEKYFPPRRRAPFQSK